MFSSLSGVIIQKKQDVFFTETNEQLFLFILSRPSYANHSSRNGNIIQADMVLSAECLGCADDLSCVTRGGTIFHFLKKKHFLL